MAAWMGGQLEEEKIPVYVYGYGWVPLQLTWNYHNVVNWLYSNI